jgi:hypothetical protein
MIVIGGVVAWELVVPSKPTSKFTKFDRNAALQQQFINFL